MERAEELIRPLGYFPLTRTYLPLSHHILHMHGPLRPNAPNPVHPPQSRAVSEETWSSAVTRTRTTMVLLGRTGMEMGAEMCI